MILSGKEIKVNVELFQCDSMALVDVTQPTHYTGCFLDATNIFERYRINDFYFFGIFFFSNYINDISL